MNEPKPGSIVKFGAYDWRVLDVQNGKALLISEDVTHVNMPYNKDHTHVTWETCTLRKWLNDDFLSAFSAQEQSRIALTININEDNQWYDSKAGDRTSDSIFLLSISEVVKHFGDSGQLKTKNPKSKFYIDDQYNQERMANYNGSSAWWWLRSPGISFDGAAYVFSNGRIYITGVIFDYSLADGGVRPALWLQL